MTSHPVDIHVGKRLALAMNLKGMTAEAIAKESGISVEQVNEHLEGTGRIGSSRLFDLSKTLGVSVGYFFEDFSSENYNKTPTEEAIQMISKANECITALRKEGCNISKENKDKLVLSFADLDENLTKMLTADL